MKRLKRYLIKHAELINNIATGIIGSVSSAGLADLAGWIDLNEIPQKWKLFVAVLIMGMKFITSITVKYIRKKATTNDTPPL